MTKSKDADWDDATHFTKRPVIFEAVQLCWKNWSRVCEFLGDIINPNNPARYGATFSDDCGETEPFIELRIPTKEGQFTVKHGDWIIEDAELGFYSVGPVYFKETYHPVTIMKPSTHGETEPVFVNFISHSTTSEKKTTGPTRSST